MPPDEGATIRAFVALELDGGSVGALARVAEELRSAEGAPSAAWVPPAKMHVTVQFMTALPCACVAPLEAALRRVAGQCATNTHAARLSAFPDVATARIVIAELDDEGEDLLRLARLVTTATSRLGIPQEDRPFRPHVTLARLRHRFDARRWLPSSTAAPVQCEPRTLTLFRSVLGPRGSTYSRLVELPLLGAR